MTVSECLFLVFKFIDKHMQNPHTVLCVLFLPILGHGKCKWLVDPF